jgi:hypothetical protein
MEVCGQDEWEILGNCNPKPIPKQSRFLLEKPNAAENHSTAFSTQEKFETS